LAESLKHKHDQDDDCSDSENAVTPAQVLLRWGLDRGCPVIPKSTSKNRMIENANIFDFRLSKDQVNTLQSQLLNRVKENNSTSQDETLDKGEEGEDIEKLTRLCWRRDPLRHLDFD